MPGSRIIYDYTIVSGLALVGLPPGITVPEAILILEHSEAVLYANPNDVITWD